MMTKTTYLLLFVFFTSLLKAQTTDFLFVPNQNSFVGTYNSSSLIGAYFGGYYILSVHPYTYTTPLSFFNRVGLTFGNDRVSLMGGIFLPDIPPTLLIKPIPDVWLKINPIRILSGKDTAFDFSLGLNYSKSINYGVGISIRY